MIRLFLLCLFASASVWAAPAAFDEAARLYDAQDYTGARARYEQLLSEGIYTPNLFYNLGNTEFRLRRPGYAALAYERALLLEPRHHEAEANLSLLRSQAGAKSLPRSPLEGLLLPIPLHLYLVTGAIAFWASLLSGTALLLWRKARRRLTMILMLGVLLAGYSAAALWRVKRDRAVAVVVVPEATARLEAADRAGVAEVLPAGSDVRVLSEHGAWVYCELPGRGRGWLPQKNIERVAPST
jgi:tetratricopeptide (TPR) repeat protein